MRNSIASLLAACALTVAAATAAAQAPDPIAVLKSGASLAEKQEACRQLSIHGTQDAVPVLAPLLTDESLSHMARYALEPMPFPEAGEALRSALEKTRGRPKVGIVNSLGNRKDEQAVRQLIKLLRDRDADVAQASARALGAIANSKSAKALERAAARAKLAPGMRDALCDGLFAVAERRVHESKREEALEIYDRLLVRDDSTPQIRTAALRGAVLNRSAGDGIPLLVDRVRGGDDDAFAAALRVCREMDNDRAAAIAALAGALPAAAPDRQVRILDVFGSGDGESAGAAALALANDGAGDVRIAALRAATRMNYGPALDVLARLALSDDKTLADTAQSSLAHFPGPGRSAAIEGLLKSDQAKTRGVALALIGEGGLENPVALLMNTAETDSDAGVRVAALEGLREFAGSEELPRLLSKLIAAQSQPEMQAAESALMAVCERQRALPGAIVIQRAVYGDVPNGPSANVLDQVARMVADGARSVEATNGSFGDPAPNVPKKLQVDYTENGTPVTRTVNEGETLKFSGATASPVVVDALCGAFKQSQGGAKLATLRLLGAAGSPQALEVVRAATRAGATEDVALQVLCNWPTSDALPDVLKLATSSADSSIRDAALRGAIRLLGQGGDSPERTVQQYSTLMAQARTPDDRRLVLSGLTQVSHAGALELALAQLGDATVKAEAAQAALVIANGLGKAAHEDTSVFNGVDLTGWHGNAQLWRVEDGAIVGQSNAATTQDETLRSDISVSDFYLVADVLIDPNTGDGALAFRLGKANATGYRAGVGQDAWGRLSRGPGQAMLDLSGTAEAAVKPGQWNRYEVLAVGPAIWVAIDGKLGAAYIEKNKDVPQSGPIAIELGSGPPQTVRCRIRKLVRDPKIEMEGLGTKDLLAALH